MVAASLEFGSTGIILYIYIRSNIYGVLTLRAHMFSFQNFAKLIIFFIFFVPIISWGLIFNTDVQNFPGFALCNGQAYRTFFTTKYSGKHSCRISCQRTVRIVSIGRNGRFYRIGSFWRIVPVCQIFLKMFQGDKMILLWMRFWSSLKHTK